MQMDSIQRELAQKLVDGALATRPQERLAYLKNACPTDSRLLEYVLRMIASAENHPTCLETSALSQLLSYPLFEPGNLVEGRFQIVRLVGQGGMGEVYEAQDTELDERVALKTIRRLLSGVDEIAMSLRREIQLVHRIAHPNVCKIHYLGVDRSEDVVYLTMDFLDGETLFDRVERTGPLPPEQALAIARQIAAGLDAAHQEGIIHRDLKSRNIMLVPRIDGTTRAVIMDFGLAGTHNEEDPETIGFGTPAYMAPERMREPGARPATDIYSFGVILYEMVTARMPFDSGTPPDQRTQQLPPAPSAINRGISRRWDRACLRCLHPSPDQRFRQASDAVSTLSPRRRPVVLAAVLVAVLLAYLPVRALIGWMTAGPVQVLAFLPFESNGGSSFQDGLADYLAEQIQRNPALRSKWLVFSPAEVRQMHATDAARANAVLGASHIIRGTMSRQSQSVTMNGELVDAKTLRTVSTFEKTCPLDDAVCLQDGMLYSVVGIFTPQNSSFAQTLSISNEATQYYLQALYYLRRDSVSYGLAIPLLEQAIVKDP